MATKPSTCKQVGDDHVAERAGLLEEAGAALDRQLLRHVDLDVVDVLAVPDRLEQAVAEAKGEDVLHRLLAEEVVDPEDLCLFEHAVQGLVERSRGGEIVAERLLDDQPRALGETGGAEHLHHRRERVRRNGEVDQPPDIGSELLLGSGDRFAAARPAARRSRPRRRECAANGSQFSSLSSRRPNSASAARTYERKPSASGAPSGRPEPTIR